MKIAVCGLLKFHDELLEVGKKLKQLGHTVYTPAKADSVDYWAKDGYKWGRSHDIR